jgi:hypothetical protein
LRSKKFLFFCIVLVCLSGGLWYFITGHSMPAHARYIPGDAVAVVTLNTKRLATDILLGGDLKQDTGISENKLLARWKKASDKNGGPGISLSSDILFFGCMCQTNKQLYVGMVLKTDNEQKLIQFVTKELPGLFDSATFQLSMLTDHKTYRSFVVKNKVNGNSFCIGLNEEAFVLITAVYQSGDPEFLAKEMNRIFNQSKESSMAALANFKNAQRPASDISFWFNLNAAPWKSLFTQTKELKDEPGYINAWLDFNKGAADLTIFTILPDRKRAAIFRKSHAANDFLSIVRSDKFIGLLHADIDLPNLFSNMNSIGKERGLNELLEGWGLTEKDLATCFTGRAALSVNGFVHYKKKYMDYEYDADFNRQEVEKYREERIPGFTCMLGMDGSKAMFSILPKLLEKKSIRPRADGSYQLNSDIPVYIFPVGNHLYLSSFDHPVLSLPDAQPVFKKEIIELAEYHSSFIFCDLKGLRTQLLSEFPKNDADAKKIWDTVKSASLTADEEPGRRSLHFVLHFSEAKTNALIQVFNLLQDLKKH